MKKIEWQKKGLIFKPSADLEWMQSHAMLPTAEHIDNGLYKVYFGSRNKNNQSHIGYILLDLDSLSILEISKEPVLCPGKLGTFDDNGVLPSSIQVIENVKYMYHIGFKPGGTTRMDLFGGISYFKEDGTLQRYSEAPIIERCRVNPYINTAPFVIKTPPGSFYQYYMYYVAGCGWIHKDLPEYNIQIAFSNNGIDWIRNGDICIDFQNEDEVALARPYVIYLNNKYHMWFSYKGSAYRIGYATSEDGINWIRSDKVGGMKESADKNSFDSEMVAYGYVIVHNNKYHMLYNGNNYGQTGIGLAIADA